jgi:hypothetical protein
VVGIIGVGFVGSLVVGVRCSDIYAHAGYGVLFHLGCLWTLTFIGVGGGDFM